jgi:hypothetical protein
VDTLIGAVFEAADLDALLPRYRKNHYVAVTEVGEPVSEASRGRRPDSAACAIGTGGPRHHARGMRNRPGSAGVAGAGRSRRRPGDDRIRRTTADRDQCSRRPLAGPHRALHGRAPVGRGALAGTPRCASSRRTNAPRRRGADRPDPGDVSPTSRDVVGTSYARLRPQFRSIYGPTIGDTSGCGSWRRCRCSTAPRSRT